MHVFGKSLRFLFTPIIDGTPTGALHSLVSARIYAAEPSEAQKENSAGGEIQAVTTWTNEGDHYLIVFSPLVDSEPHDTEDFEDYFVTVNFRFENGGPIKFVTEKIFVYRPDAVTSRVQVSDVDLILLEPKFDQFLTASELLGFVSQAKEDVFHRLEGAGYKRRRLFNLQKLNRCVLYRAAFHACMSLYGEQTPHWKDKALARQEQYKDAYSALTVGYDVEGEGNPKEGDRAETRVLYLRR